MTTTPQVHLQWAMDPLDGAWAEWGSFEAVVRPNGRGGFSYTVTREESRIAAGVVSTEERARWAAERAVQVEIAREP